MTLVPYVLEVGGQEVVLTPDPAHEFTATSEQVALGYGVSASTIRDHKANRPEELVEGKHWVVGVIDTPGGQQNLTLWTKRGIVRLGFFIRSKRARLFRDMAEDLVLSALTQPAPQPAAPALISAEAFGRVTGQSRNSVLNYCKRRLNLQPAAVGFKKDRQGMYLYDLGELIGGYERTGWTFDPATQFDTYSGRVTHDLNAVTTQKRRGVLTRSAPQRQPMPRLLDSQPVTRVEAAQELVQLEQRRAYLLGVLA